MAEPPFFSIITPSYQGQCFYERFFSSLAKQTQKNFDIVICLRLSSPEESTAQAENDLRSIAEQYHLNQLITICFDFEELGVAHQRNLAMELATGAYFSFLDIDDTWLPGRCERMEAWLRAHPHIDLLHHMMVIRNLAQGGVNEYPLGLQKKTDLKELLVGQDILNSAAIMNRKIYDEGWRQDLTLDVSQDWAGWLKIVSLGYHVQYLPENWGTYFWTSESLSSHTELALYNQIFLIEKYQSQIDHCDWFGKSALARRLSIFHYTAGLSALRQRNLKLSQKRLWQAWKHFPFQLRVPLQIGLSFFHMEIWDLKKAPAGPLPRVMVILPSLKMGGAERAIISLLSTADLTRAEWHLVLLHPRDDEAFTVPKGILVHELNASRLITALPALLAKIHRFSPTTVISTLTHLNIALCGLRVFFPKATRLFCREASLLRTNSEQESHPRRYRSLVRWCYPLADRIVCLSESMRRELISHAKFMEQQCLVIPNGLALNTNTDKVSQYRKESTSPVPHSPFSQFGSGPHIIVVGRLDHNKGGHTAIKAFQAWLSSHPHAQLYFLGTGPCLSIWSELARDLGVSDSVHFVGQQENLVPWYQQAHLMLMASKQEGLPNVLIEAIAFGCPVQVLQHEGGGLEILKSVGLESRWVTHLEQPLLDKSLSEVASVVCRDVYDQKKVTMAWERLIFEDHAQN